MAAIGAEREPGQLLGAIFSASPDAIVVIDDTGAIVVSSPAVTALFGYYPEELVGEALEILLPLRQREVHLTHIRAFFAEPRARQMGAGLKLAGRHRDGTEFPVDVSLAPVALRGRSYAAAFVRDARERQRTVDRLHAVNEITERLLGGTDVRDILPLVARSARRLSRSDAVWIAMPSPAEELEIIAADGSGTDPLVGVVLSGETSRSAQAMRTGSSVVVEDFSSATNVPDTAVELNLGPGMYVPLIAEGRGLGTLVLARVRGQPVYRDIDVAFAEVFAGAIAAALEVGAVRAEVERLGIVAEDERIARDLHDTVIQQLFALGMSLQATRVSVTGPVGDRIDAAVNDLDNVIKEIRNTIFRLPGRAATATGLREEMLRLADKYRDELGFSPRVAFDGPVDSAVSDVVAAQLLQVFAEGLSNVARHARATAVEVIVTIEDGWLTLALADDGVGITGEPTAGSGLRNLVSRAADLGGSSSVRRREPSGTVVEWRVPL